MGSRSSEVPGSGSVQTSGFDASRALNPEQMAEDVELRQRLIWGNRFSLVRLKVPLGQQSSVGLTSCAKNKRSIEPLSAPAGKAEAQPP